MSTQAIRKRVTKSGAVGSVTSESTIRFADKSVQQVTPQRTEVITKGCDHPNPAYVTVSGGITKNLGDFNSAKIGIEVTMPCLPTQAGVEECYAEISAIVDHLMDVEHMKVMGNSPERD